MLILFSRLFLYIVPYYKEKQIAKLENHFQAIFTPIPELGGVVLFVVSILKDREVLCVLIGMTD